MSSTRKLRSRQLGRRGSQLVVRYGRGGEVIMRGSNVVYPGPARLVLAAASQLRDAALIERHAEEWLANLRGRTYRQQWRDSVSLLLRGARTTRFIYDGTCNSQPGMIVAAQAVMALITMAGTGFLFYFPSQIEILAGSPSVAFYKGFGEISFKTSARECLCWQAASPARDGYILTEPVMLTLFLSLATVSTLGIALLFRRPRLAILVGITVSTLAAYCAIHLLAYADYRDFNIIIWWVIAGTLAVFLHHKIHPIIRALAALEFMGILRVSPLNWLPHEASQLILRIIDFLQLSLDPLYSAHVGKVITFRIVLGVAFLLCGFSAWILLRCAMVANSLIRSARYDIGGIRTCLQ